MRALGSRAGPSDAAGAPRRRAARPCRATAGAGGAGAQAGGGGAAAAPGARLTCRRCKCEFLEGANARGACRFHPAIYTGGEVAKVGPPRAVPPLGAARAAARIAGVVLRQPPAPPGPPPAPQAVGFVRQSAAPEHQLEAVMGRKGLMRCGNRRRRRRLLRRGAKNC
jgi:hypothetical protein